jgi:ribonucleoside-diphosphate reductase alpha chain
MEALKTESDYDLINPRNGEVRNRLKAQEVFDKIVAGAWRNGEPGVIFLDKINEKNPTPQEGVIEATNPCGEQPLLPYESCNLGAINLKRFVKFDNHGKGEVDWQKLENSITDVVHFLDNVIDVNKYPIPEIEALTKKNRKIGITVMGFADMLYDLGIAYDSEEGITMAEKIMAFVEERSHAESAKLVKTRGEFPNFKGSIWDKPGAPKMHNAATTSCNPTGTLSILGTCSSGIEPFFALAYTKTVMDNDALPEVNEHFLRVAKDRGFYSDDLMKEISDKGTIQEIESIPEDIKEVFKVAADIAPEWHVRMQAAFQKHTDGAISKTINFPNSATVEQVREAYLLAYKLSCKGITVYRDGSRAYQVLTTGKKEKDETSQAVVSENVKLIPRDRPSMMNGVTYKVKTGYGNLYITINDDENGDPFEVFSHLGKTGGFFAAKAEAICRLISLALRSGVDVHNVIEQIKGIRGPTPTWGEDGKMVLSMPDAIAQILEKHIAREQIKLDLDFKNGSPIEIPADDPDEVARKEINQPQVSLADAGEAPACPECGAMLEFGEGCMKCQSCGYSKCA